MAEFSDEETPRILSSERLGIRMNENEKVKDFNERFITLLNRIPIKPAKAVQIEYYTSSLHPNIAMFVKNQEKTNFGGQFCKSYPS
jgi:predicted NAD/FAD-binding protein